MQKRKEKFNKQEVCTLNKVCNKKNFHTEPNVTLNLVQGLLTLSLNVDCGNDVDAEIEDSRTLLKSNNKEQ